MALRCGSIGIVLAHPTASRRLHSTASAASSSCCRCGGGFRACSCRNCRQFLDFVSNAQRAPREDRLRGNAVAMPHREGIRNHAVGHPATFGTQGLHVPSGYAKLFSHTVAMTTSGSHSWRQQYTQWMGRDGWHCRAS